MQKKTRFSSYNDGVAGLYRKKTDRNVRGMEDLEMIGKLAFEEKSIRQEDRELAMQNDQNLSLKIVTPDDGNMDTSRLVAVDGVLYAIINIDRDRKKRQLYFYLKEVRRIDK